MESGSGLAFESVWAGYGPRSVLEDLDLTVAPGEIVAMFGHNGAGKTTALRVAAGLKRPSRGSVRIHGANAGRREASSRAREGLSLVVEGAWGVFPHLSVRKNLEVARRHGVPAERHGELEGRLREAFGDVLRAKADQKAGSLSGGQRQMLALSVALIRDPSVLLLDEPSTGLAPSVVRSILEVVGDLTRQAGTAVLLVEQDIAAAELIADRVVILRSGKVAATFTAGDWPDPTELWKYF